MRNEIYKKTLNKKTGVIEDVLSDEGITDKRLLVIEGELAQTLKVLSREGNTLSAVIRNAWDSGNLQTLAKNSPTKATGAHISIIGHITKQELTRSLSEIETGNGFANRFLWFCVDRSKVLPFGGDFDTIDLESLSNKLRDSVKFAQEPGKIIWAEKTRPLWQEVYPELSESKPGLIGKITQRAEAQVVRLASIYALLDCSLEILPAHLSAALEIWDYAYNSVRYIFQSTKTVPLAERILQLLACNPEGAGRWEINNALGRNYESERISEALETLKDADLAYSKKIETKGRPTEKWFFKKDMYEENEERV